MSNNLLKITDEEKKEYKNILVCLDKSTCRSNIQALHYCKHVIFKKEQNQKGEKHEDNYFYKFVYYYFTNNLKDKFLDRFSIDKIINNIFNIIFFIFLLVLGAILSYIGFNFFDKLLNSNDHNTWINLLSIIILVTTIVTASFFVVKIFVDKSSKKHVKRLSKSFR